MKVPKNLEKNEIDKSIGLPKVGVPLALVELQFPPLHWLEKKNHNYAVRVIFPKNCQYTYKRIQTVIGGIQRFNLEGQPTNSRMQTMKYTCTNILPSFRSEAEEGRVGLRILNCFGRGFLYPVHRSRNWGGEEHPPESSIPAAEQCGNEDPASCKVGQAEY